MALRDAVQEEIERLRKDAAACRKGASAFDRGRDAAYENCAYRLANLLNEGGRGS
jgi:hypothetical protein